MFGRFSLANSTSPGVGAFDGWLGGATNSIDNARSAVISDTHVFSPAVVHEVRFGFLRTNSSSTVPDINQGVVFARQQNVPLFPFPVLFFPSINFTYSGRHLDTKVQAAWQIVHGAMAFGGQLCFAQYLRQSVLEALEIPAPDWVYIDDLLQTN